MAELKSIVAKNIVELRMSHSMTQLELAERLHYTDKAVSKWERAESVPEISTLIAIAKIFNVSLDYLVEEVHDVPTLPTKANGSLSSRNRSIISAMSVLIVWFVALVVYVVFDMISSTYVMHWIGFVYAVPVSMLLILVFNSVWFDRRRNYVIISIMMWTLLISIHLTVLGCGYNHWQLYLLGIPGQICIILWSSLKPKKR